MKKKVIKYSIMVLLGRNEATEGVETLAEKLEVYSECYAYQGRRITLRKTEMGDAQDLLACYSDEEARERFNSDNCLDNFHYDTLEEMENEIQFWLDSYERGEFVRWSILLNETHRIIGTVEMFGEDKRGFLRLDIQSRYEEDKMLRDILRIVDNFFYEVFDVTEIVTKCREQDEVRKAALIQSGYKPFEEPVKGFYDYFIRHVNF